MRSPCIRTEHQSEQGRLSRASANTRAAAASKPGPENNDATRTRHGQQARSSTRYVFAAMREDGERPPRRLVNALLKRGRPSYSTTASLTSTAVQG